MKKTFTLLLMLISTYVISQPTLNSGWFPTVGYSINNAYFDATSVSEGPSGANQTWNFSVTPNGNTFTNTFLLPSSTPYAASFPGANISITGTSTGGAPFFSYFNHNTNLTELKGIAYNDLSTGLLIQFYFSNGLTNLVYPTTYNTTFTDTYSGSYSVVYQGITIINNRIGTITSHVDGYGNLTTPAGTFNNVLRIKTYQVTYDTTLYIGAPIDPVATTSKITSYSWTGSSIGQYSLAQISYDTITNDLGTPPSYNKSGYYQTSVTVGINEINLKEIVHSYPNPAIDYTKIDVSSLESGEALLQVFDVSGRLVRDQTISVGNGNDKYVILHLENFSTGLYQLNILQKDKILNSKFIKH